MTPQVEDAAALEAPAKQRAGQLRPGDHWTLNREPPEVVESLAFYRVPGESQRPVWESLSTRRHQREPGRRPRKIEGKHFDAAQAGVARLSNHLDVSGGVLALRRAKHAAWHTGNVFDPGL